MDAGFQQAVEVGELMQEARASISRVSEIVIEIAAASDEQTRGIEQVIGVVARCLHQHTVPDTQLLVQRKQLRHWRFRGGIRRVGRLGKSIPRSVDVPMAIPHAAVQFPDRVMGFSQKRFLSASCRPTNR